MWREDSIAIAFPDTAGLVVDTPAPPVEEPSAQVGGKAVDKFAGKVVDKFAGKNFDKVVNKTIDNVADTFIASPDTLAANFDSLSLPIISNIKEAAPVDTSLFYKKNFFTEAAVVPVDSVPEVQGSQGIPAMSLATDNGLVAALIVCFLLTLPAVVEARRYLAVRAKNFFRSKRRTDDDDGASAALPSLWFLTFETCLFYAFLLFVYIDKTVSGAFAVGSYRLIGLLAAGVIVFLLVKAGLQQSVGWTFFGPECTKRYAGAKGFLLACEGLFLLPAVVVSICYDTAWRSVLAYVLGVFALFRLLAIYKAGQIFFARKGSISGFLAYLCTLEIVPFFLIWSALALLGGQSGDFW
ncbi:MAG: DUF4271 domain-containing protein [Prevotella sp.]|nr:DUF4271 domain-containing protein [Prevotella sp.]